MVQTDAEDADLPRGIALAWGVAANPQRGPKREMSVESIVEAAVELADAEGLGAVSMAAVAARLGLHADVALPLRDGEGRPASCSCRRRRPGFRPSRWVRPGVARPARGALPRDGPALSRSSLDARHPDQRIADDPEQRRVDGCRSRRALRPRRCRTGRAPVGDALPHGAGPLVRLGASVVRPNGSGRITSPRRRSPGARMPCSGG